jgi:hypothetical protein
MGRMVVLLFATIAVWGSVGWVLTELPSADNGTILILGIIAFLSTGIIWGIGGNVAVYEKTPAARRESFDHADAKPKRTTSTRSLASLVDDLTPEQVAALEIALQRRHDAFDEDDQILANRLSAELERSSRST